ncbi:response regulator [Cohnella hashimotonis]|uniref:Response regulator n=1 Tax=Cohnella hashimotonis TaxID=2826895 RepID=A0ABT6TQK3_9BACL|nr:response regulator [Cohnella hashimotonis]MDI4648102.1 response regulator [Cohnella hashimotonis]
MYKVLIVDDEYYFRQALKISLPWTDLGFQIAGEAKNGAEALALLPELQPDVVLVDMNMPIMDGIEFIQKAKQRDQDTKFMVLSGHSEFVYARQAVHLGVFDYVLKPINEGELRGSLLDMKEQIQTERMGRMELEDLRKKARDSLPVLKEQVLNGLLQGNGQAAAASGQERLASLGIDLKGPYYSAVAIDLDPCDDWNREEDPLARKAAVQAIAQREMESAYPCAVCRDYEDRLVLVVGSPDGSSDALEAMCRTIRDKVRELPCSATIGIGGACRSLAAISGSYKEALLALKRRFVMGGDEVFAYAAAPETGMNVSLFPVEKRSGLLMGMRVGNPSETEAWLADFFGHVRAKQASIEMLLLAGMEIVSTCVEFLAEASQSFEDVFGQESQPDMLQRVQQMKTLTELEGWIRALILKVMDHVHRRKPNRSAKVIEEVKAYIASHYGNEELRIEDIAKSVHMNYNHLCFVFKKETTVTINDYLTETRIMKAKELFDRGDTVIQVVATRVGYADANYFGKCFKKYMGIPPSKYINKMG